MHPRAALLVAVLCFGAWPSSSSAADGDLLRNGDLTAWTDGRPDHWSQREGARQQGDAVASVVEPLPQGGIALTGDAKTTRWALISQRIAPAARAYLELTFEARARDLTQEPGQFGSSYVGFLYRDGDGGMTGFHVQDVRQGAWREDAVHVRVPASVATVEVAIFLSMTGRLEVRRMHVRVVPASDAFDVLVAEMDRQYSYFHAHEIDWAALTAKHGKAARAAKTPAAFATAITPLLAALEDGHVWIQHGKAPPIHPFAPKIQRNFELQPLLDRLDDVSQVIRNVLRAKTRDGFGYLALGTMQGTPAQLNAVEEAWRGLFEAPGLILDLRVNGGGQEMWGQRLAGYLTTKRVLYGRALRRAGPEHDDFMQGGDRYLVPNKGRTYAGPVVALIGPGCVSSGEGLAMMLKVLPQVTLVGLPTRGSSGNPMPVELPNGVTVWFSRWVNQLPDGTVTERVGIQPDVVVKHKEGQDPALDEAVKILKAKTAGR